MTLNRDQKKEMIIIALFLKKKSELNYSYIVTFNASFKKTKIVAKENKIFVCYKNDMNLISNSKLSLKR